MARPSELQLITLLVACRYGFDGHSAKSRASEASPTGWTYRARESASSGSAPRTPSGMAADSPARAARVSNPPLLREHTA